MKTVIPIHRNWNKKDKNYRGITLMNVVDKVCVRVIYKLSKGKK